MEGLKEQLEALEVKLQGQSKEVVNDLINDFKNENATVIETAVKDVKTSIEVKLDALQKQADELDVKLQKKAKKEQYKNDAIKTMIADNFKDIANVRKGNSINVKVVGDMPRNSNPDAIIMLSRFAANEIGLTKKYTRVKLYYLRASSTE